jgi:hypothetical protein
MDDVELGLIFFLVKVVGFPKRNLRLPAPVAVV